MQAKSLVQIAENALNLGELPDIKKMAGYKDFYRIRVGGLRLVSNLNPESGAKIARTSPFVITIVRPPAFI